MKNKKINMLIPNFIHKFNNHHKRQQLKEFKRICIFKVFFYLKIY